MALAADAPLFYRTVEFYLDRAVFYFAVVVIAWAFIHAAMQRADAFSAVSSLRKNSWLGILGGLLAATIVFYLVGFLVIVMYIGIAAAAYYLLEVRRGIKDVSEGSW